MASLQWIPFFILASDFTFQSNPPILNIGILHYSTATTGITRDVIESWFRRDIADNDLRSFRLIWESVNTSSQIQVINTAYNLIDSGIHVLISAVRCPQMFSVCTVTETRRIPHFALHIETCHHSRNETYTIHLVNPFHYLPTLVADIAVKEKWKKVTLALDDDCNVSRYVKELSKVGIMSVLENISHLILVERTMPENVLLVTKNRHLIHRLFNYTNVRRLQKWIFVTEDEQLWNLVDPTTNLIWVKTSYNKFIKGDCSRELSLSYTQSELIDVVQTILAYFQCNPADQNVTERPSCIKAKPESREWTDGLLQDVKKVCGIKQSPYSGVICNRVEYELFGQPLLGTWRAEPSGVWTPSKGLTLRQSRESLFRDHLIDFGGISLKVAVHGDSAPFSGLNNTSGISYEGFVIDMMEDMSKILNFNYVLVEPEDKLYGHELENGTWTGLIGMAQRGEVDVAAGSISVTVQRSGAVDFVTPFMQDGLGIIAPRPVRKADMFQTFKPFSPYVWLMVLACGIVVSLGMILVQYLLGPDPAYPDGTDKWAQECFFVVLSAFFEQGLCWQPVRGSVRCLLGFWFVFTILTIAIYTARQAAVLTVSSPLKPINNLEDLASRPDINVIAGYGTTAWAFFQESTIPVYKTIAKRMTAVDLGPALLKRVVAGEIAWLSDTSYLVFLETQSCGAARVGAEKFQSVSQSFAVPKNSPYKYGFDISVQKMVESGIARKLEKKWLYQRANCTSHKTEDPFQSLDFSRLGGVFIIFGAFAFIAIVSVLIETLHYSSRLREKESK